MNHGGGIQNTKVKKTERQGRKKIKKEKQREKKSEKTIDRGRPKIRKKEKRRKSRNKEGEAPIGQGTVTSHLRLHQHAQVRSSVY
jgi:hypothetical protein